MSWSLSVTSFCDWWRPLRSKCLAAIYTHLLKKHVRLGCITQGSLAEITNQRFSLKYQAFRQLAAVLISDQCCLNLKGLCQSHFTYTLTFFSSFFASSSLCLVRTHLLLRTTWMVRSQAAQAPSSASIENCQPWSSTARFKSVSHSEIHCQPLRSGSVSLVISSRSAFA